MRLLAQSFHWIVRLLAARPRAALLALSITAAGLAVGVAYSQQDPERSRAKGASDASDAANASIAAYTSNASGRASKGPRRGGAAYYRRTARKYVPPKGARAFLPLYREAERQYAVSWRLLASIHRQETAFSTSKTTYHGLNDFGCCAGPMQFNVTNGPVSTWERYRDAFRDGRRPERYPHRTRKHPSIYDDFDAIMAAGSLLSSLGAGPELDERAWHAAFGYYGHDLYGITYASQVLARAEEWQRKGFCPNCEVDQSLVEEFDRAYGEAARVQLGADDSAKDKKKKKKKRKRNKRRGEERREREKRARDRARQRARPQTRRTPRPRRAPSPPRARRERKKPSAPAPAPSAPPAAPPPTAAPPERECPPISKLLGCKP